MSAGTARSDELVLSLSDTMQRSSVSIDVDMYPPHMDMCRSVHDAVRAS
ncbi:MAG: hypothetical protein ABEJ65_01835 [bacterium]